MSGKRQRGLRKTREGVVISDKMDKTVVVLVERLVSHPLYRRVMRRRRKYMAHDETNQCRIGDLVRIVECRPLSKHKSWRVVEIIRRGEATSPAEVLGESVEVTDEVQEIVTGEEPRTVPAGGAEGQAGEMAGGAEQSE
ncbi:MAG: 30S ribosomal protein S17 [Armatimonadetes bacterium]|nr:30S ribosomal protein S17 [Armatimonadota bacterium]